MPIGYIVPIIGGNQRNSTLMRILISRVSELEKLQEVRMQAIETTLIQ